MNVEQDNKLYFTYDQIHELIQSKKQEILEFDPEIIVGIGTGGFIPARIVKSIIEHENRNIDFYAVIVSFYNEIDEKTDRPVKKQWLNDQNINHIKDKRVLIIDELDDTRTTLSFVQKEISSYSPKSVGIFVVHNKLKDKNEHLDDECDYIYCEEIPDKWVVYPWE